MSRTSAMGAALVAASSLLLAMPVANARPLLTVCHESDGAHQIGVVDPQGSDFIGSPPLPGPCPTGPGLLP